MDQHRKLKYHPESLVPGARSVIVAGMNYYQIAPWKKGLLLDEGASSLARVTRYAWGRDYHKTLKQKLKQLDTRIREQHPTMQSRIFTDSGPLHERLAADGAGIAFTGKHTLSINKKLGSWFFLGLIITDLDIEPSGILRNPLQDTVHPQGSCPSGCTRCLDICPTGALTAAMYIDARRCISYLTIEHKGSVPEELRPLMGDWIFGCDLCQEACPFNLRAEQTGVQDFLVHRAGSRLGLTDILSLADDSAFTARFAGSPLMRAGRESLLRNACIAAANRGDRSLLTVLQDLACHDVSEVVREHARWAVSRLEKT